MKFKLWLIIIVTLIIIIIIGAVNLFIKNNEYPSDYNSFTKCLNESGAKLYGAFWCSHCKSQKEMFGESKKYLPYVECDAGSYEQINECNEALIEFYPTWTFKNGTKKVGVLTFKTLSDLSGCKLQK
ncbi:MAG TPA: hypothetical protein P5277_02060 [Candidatus Paceibacterota bacterium]|nr:hypothetical protein [Candidatus Paceibacterota bacterium]